MASDVVLFFNTYTLLKKRNRNKPMYEVTKLHKLVIVIYPIYTITD